MSTFASRSAVTLQNAQMRRNLRKATTTIRAKTAAVTAELPDWEALRDAGRDIKAGAMARLDEHLERLEQTVTAAGGQVRWARDAAEARDIVTNLARQHGAREVIKIKSMTTDEIELNPALEAAGITPFETDLADMIVQMAKEKPSHLLVPAIHKNRVEIRDLFREKMDRPDLSERPADLALGARNYLRDKFISTGFAISGANFAVAETGSVAVVESEGNGRMCLTLPKVLVSIVGIEKILPRWDDLSVFLQLLPRSATGERMNPYTSIWTGVHAGDGPQAFHLVLLDNGRSAILADEAARETLHCIRCSRCLNVCPVYERAGGHAYDSMYQGPIGAIATPQIRGFAEAGDLPFASTLCGACEEACPVRIPIPKILVHLRARAVRERQGGGQDALAMQLAARLFDSAGTLEFGQWLARLGAGPLVRNGTIPWLPGPLKGWSASRDFPAPAKETFRQWWAKRGDGP